jgi:hypothetical protein
VHLINVVVQQNEADSYASQAVKLGNPAQGAIYFRLKFGLPLDASLESLPAVSNENCGFQHNKGGFLLRGVSLRKESAI